MWLKAHSQWLSANMLLFDPHVVSNYGCMCVFVLNTSFVSLACIPTVKTNKKFHTPVRHRAASQWKCTHTTHIVAALVMSSTNCHILLYFFVFVLAFFTPTPPVAHPCILGGGISLWTSLSEISSRFFPLEDLSWVGSCSCCGPVKPHWMQY